MTSRPVIDNMEGLSINTGCFAVNTAIARTSAAISRFVREVRESRSDFDIISSELHSLDNVIELLKDDSSSFPPQLATKTPAILDTCLAIVNELEGCITVLDRIGVARADKKSRWLASREHIGKLRWTLADYKSTLGLAADLVALSRPRNIIYQDRILPESDADRKYEMSKVTDDIADLSATLEDEARQNGAVARLHQYLHALHVHAMTAAHLELHVSHLEEHHRAPSSLDDAPDSAIELSDGQPSPISLKLPGFVGSSTIAGPINEVDELLDQLGEMQVEAPPLPPPRSARRASSVGPCHDRRPSTTSNISDTNSIPASSGGRSSVQNNPPSRWSRINHMRSWSFSPSETQESIYEGYEGYSTPPTDISGQSDRQSGSFEKNRPDSATLDFARFSTWESPRAEAPEPELVRPTTSSSAMTQSARPPVARRSSSRLSTVMRGLRLTRKSANKIPTVQEQVPEPSSDTEYEPAQLGPRAVFGVNLVQSMQVAKGVGRDGYGSSDSRSPGSARGYPLCVLRCVYYLNEKGLETPRIFGLEADRTLLANLKDTFSSVDTGYGMIVDWDRFSVHEAAGLILLFLSELPTPLVPESVGKRWIFQSRQATVSSSLRLLEQGLDFWEEAFQGVHGASRALLRLLLNLWGDIADQAESNEMTAERLAGRVLRPLMHLSPTRYDPDLMLGLAFMIRKRSEYRVKARCGGRKSNAAF